MRRTLLASVSFFLLVSGFIQAQPTLDLKRVVNLWPAVEVYFSAECNGTPVWNLQPSDFHILDDGDEVTQFTLDCPNPSSPCVMSVGLVLDGSGSMAGSGNPGVIQAAKHFVGFLDGVQDQAAVLWFNNGTTLAQSMTTDTSLMNQAIDALPVLGQSAVWDGVFAGLVETATMGTNPCRAVIVVSDGMDNASSATFAAVLWYAQQQHIPVFPIGLGGSFNIDQFRQLAEETGGRFHHSPTVDALPAIYAEIAAVLRAAFLECRLTFDPDCPDGRIHPVELQLPDLCGAPVSVTGHYQAPRDSTAFTDLVMTLDSVATTAGMDVELTLALLTPLQNERFAPLTLDLSFNKTHLTFDGVRTPPASLLDGVPLTVTPLVNGVRLVTSDAIRITGNGELLHLRFRTNASAADTVRAAVTCASAEFSLFCHRPLIGAGLVTLVPGAPRLLCTMDVPRSLAWDSTTAAYVPAPFTTTLSIYNLGSQVSMGGHCEIAVDTTAFRLVSPPSTGITLPDIAPGAAYDATWQLAAVPRAQADSSDITMTARFDNHGDVSCMARVHIGVSDPYLVCDVQLPVLRTDVTPGRYEPHPVPVLVTVRNEGAVPAENIMVDMEYPPDMYLPGSFPGSSVAQALSPSRLAPGESGTVRWELYRPPVHSPRQDTLRFRSSAHRGGVRVCEGVLAVPEISAPILIPRCSVPDSLHWDELADQYIPNPFTISVSGANMGTDTAYAVTARPLLPDGMQLFPSTQPLRVALRTGPLAPWRIGDSVPNVSWTVAWGLRDSKDREVPVTFLLEGLSRSGDTLAPLIAHCWIRIPGLRKELACELTLPDSLALNALGTNLEPNPVILRHRVRNQGQLPMRLRRVQLEMPSDGLTISPSSPYGGSADINSTLAIGQEMEFEWVIDVAPREYARTPLFAVTVFDEEDDAHRCERQIFIPPVRGVISCTPGVPTITMDLTAQQYLPMPFPVEVDVHSMLPRLSDSLFARIVVPAGSLALVSADSARQSTPVLPVRLFPGQQARATWLLEHPITRSMERYMLDLLVWEKGGDTTRCEAEIVIPGMPAPFWFDLSASGPLEFCDGGAVTLYAGPGYASYLWSTGDTTSSIVVRTTGSYSCGVTLPDGLPGLSQHITVTVWPLPSPPVITRTGDVLTATTAVGWQWYRDGMAIQNATAQTHTAVATGMYTVRITDAHGCEALSDPFSVTILPVEEVQATDFRFLIYPNPAGDRLSIDVELVRPSAVLLTLHDLLGRERRRVERNQIHPSFIEQLDLRDLEPGIYLLRLAAGGMLRTRLLVVE